MGKHYMRKLFRENIGDCDLVYVAKEMVQKKEYHKIKSVCKRGTQEISVLYWVDVQTNQLFLMSEFQNGTYNAYWIRNTGPAPSGHNYAVNLPKKEMDKFHGYEVFDNRYLSDKLKKSGN